LTGRTADEFEKKNVCDPTEVLSRYLLEGPGKTRKVVGVSGDPAELITGN